MRTAAVLLLAAAPAAAMDYGACLEAARAAPDRALAEARRWADEGGGPAAGHCAAVALVELGALTVAARALAGLAGDPAAGDAATRAQLLTQAGGLWLEAGDPAAALTALDAALALDPAAPPALAARAEALMADGRPGAAAEHLTAAIRAAGPRPTLLLARSAARRAAGDAAGALADADAALARQAGAREAGAQKLVAEALYHRGAALAALGRAPAARAALLDAIDAGRGGPVEARARETLEDLEGARQRAQ